MTGVIYAPSFGASNEVLRAAQITCSTLNPDMKQNVNLLIEKVRAWALDLINRVNRGLKDLSEARLGLVNNNVLEWYHLKAKHASEELLKLVSDVELRNENTATFSDMNVLSAELAEGVQKCRKIAEEESENMRLFIKYIKEGPSEEISFEKWNVLLAVALGERENARSELEKKQMEERRKQSELEKKQMEERGKQSELEKKKLADSAVHLAAIRKQMEERRKRFNL